MTGKHDKTWVSKGDLIPLPRLKCARSGRLPSAISTLHIGYFIPRQGEHGRRGELIFRELKVSGTCKIFRTSSAD